jgi:diguanylate cyclase (GGDEF)-like protein
MFLDVDKFKRINDALGHQAGDHVLRTVASLIKNQLRASDIIARYGGEEFVALLPQTPHRAACDIAERIRATVEACNFEPLPGTPLSATISIGVSMLSSQAEEATVTCQAEALVAHADKALYLAKEGGRNRVVSQ